jgi:heme/copper-type cytochrome/quinol oxidase subunit 3
MSQTISLAIIVIKTIILVVGSGIAFIAYKAHRRTEAPSLRALAVGFGVVTLGALLAGIAHQVFDVSLQTGVLINSLLTALGFGIIMYSLYIER